MPVDGEILAVWILVVARGNSYMRITYCCRN